MNDGGVVLPAIKPAVLGHVSGIHVINARRRVLHDAAAPGGRVGTTRQKPSFSLQPTHQLDWLPFLSQAPMCSVGCKLRIEQLGPVQVGQHLQAPFSHVPPREQSAATGHKTIRERCKISEI